MQGPVQTAAAFVLLGAIAGACATSGPYRPQPFPGAATARPALLPARAELMGQVLATAVALTGRPYLFGGADPSAGFDCSGLIWYSFLQHRVALPRTTAQLYEAGERVDRSDIEAGDLVFFSTTSAGPSHVGLALDGYTLVHAPSTGTAVRIERFDTPYWQSRFLGVRRIDAPLPAGRSCDR